MGKSWILVHNQWIEKVILLIISNEYQMEVLFQAYHILAFNGVK